MSHLVVFDTNVLVSYFWTSNEASAAKIAVERCRDGKAVPVFSDAIMIEYTQVLNRPKFDFPQYEIASFLSLIRNNGYYVLPAVSNIPFLKDPTDKPFSNEVA